MAALLLLTTYHQTQAFQLKDLNSIVDKITLKVMNKLNIHPQLEQVKNTTNTTNTTTGPTLWGKHNKTCMGCTFNNYKYCAASQVCIRTNETCTPTNQVFYNQTTGCPVANFCKVGLNGMIFIIDDTKQKLTQGNPMYQLGMGLPSETEEVSFQENISDEQTLELRTLEEINEDVSVMSKFDRLAAQAKGLFSHNHKEGQKHHHLFNLMATNTTTTNTTKANTTTNSTTKTNTTTNSTTKTNTTTNSTTKTNTTTNSTTKTNTTSNSTVKTNTTSNSTVKTNTTSNSTVKNNTTSVNQTNTNTTTITPYSSGLAPTAASVRLTVPIDKPCVVGFVNYQKQDLALSFNNTNVAAYSYQFSYPATTKLSALKPLTILNVPATSDIMYVYIGSTTNTSANTTFGWGRKATYNPYPTSGGGGGKSQAGYLIQSFTLLGVMTFIVCSSGLSGLF
eukprot:403361173